MHQSTSLGVPEGHWIELSQLVARAHCDADGRQKSRTIERPLLSELQQKRDQLYGAWTRLVHEQYSLSGLPAGMAPACIA